MRERNKGCLSFDPLTLASSDYAKDKLSRRAREFSKITSIPPKFVPNTIELMASTGEKHTLGQETSYHLAIAAGIIGIVGPGIGSRIRTIIPTRIRARIRAIIALGIRARIRARVSPPAIAPGLPVSVVPDAVTALLPPLRLSRGSGDRQAPSNESHSY
jgi:hypothetical protein